MEKCLAPGKHLAKQRILVIAPLSHRVEQKSQQVEAEHTGRQGLLAMTKVVLQMVPLGLEHVVVVVCDLPAATTRLRNRHNVVIVQAMIGDTAMVRELFARCGMDDRDLEPMDRQGIVTTAQAHVVEGAHHRHFREATIPVASFTLGHTVVGLPKRQALRERGMRVGRTRQDEGETVLEHQRTQGLVAGEILAQSGHTVGCHVRGMLVNPAGACRPFAVLFGMPVLRHDVLGGQGKDL